MSSQAVKAYYRLAKPGIVYGNALPAIGGFFVALHGHFSFLVFLSMLVGLSLVIACGCVLNNYIDRGIDSKMERTKSRPTITGEISGRNALIYATALGVIGFALLVFFVNWLAALVAFAGLFFYVVVYGFAKRHTSWSTLIGSISGAVPPVVGYVAATNRLDLEALLLFLILAFWQMPHFYAIALFRSDDYAAANIPVLPLKKGIMATKRQMIFFVCAFIVVVLAFPYFGFAGYTFAGVMVLLSAWWLDLSIQGFRMREPDRTLKWAHKMFGFSLVILLVLSCALSINVLLP